MRQNADDTHARATSILLPEVGEIVGRMIERTFGVKSTVTGVGDVVARPKGEKGRDRGGGESIGDGGNKDDALVGDVAEIGGVILVDLVGPVTIGAALLRSLGVTSCSTLVFECNCGVVGKE